MESLLSFIGYIFNFTMIAAFALFVFKFIQARKNSGEKNQIQNLNAKLSMVRMTLKAKIKGKSNKYRALFKFGITAGDPVDLLLNELIGLSLENGDDLQRYFDISKQINSLIVAEAAKEAAKEVARQSLDGKTDQPARDTSHIGKEDFMGTDFKSEIAILRLIKEMVEVSVALNKRIDHFNSASPKNPIARVNPLSFSSYIEVNRVFVSDKSEPRSGSEAA